jgi:protein involved in polysaccharide export with SLBB domain
MMRSLTFCLIALALAMPALGAPGDGSNPERGPMVTPSYRFVPGDVIDITVSSHPGRDRTVTIPPDGRISFPRAGEIPAAGLTAAELAARLQELLSAQLVDPRVTVSLNKQAARRVSLLGAVRAPGGIEMKDGMTVAEALAAGGGPTPLADLHRVTITRADQSVVTVDLAQAETTGRLERNALVQPGDIIVVPEGAPPTVVVMGEAARPGSYEIQGNSRVTDAVAQAGGPTPKADLTHVRLTRAGQVQVLDLGGLAAGAGKTDPAANPLVLPGDTIVLPENENQVYLLGEVAKPDAYRLREGDHLLDVLTRAGGTTREANSRQAMLIRRDAQGQPVAQSLDLQKMLTKGEMQNNVALQQGDVIVVPPKKVKNPSALTTLLYPFVSLLSLFR